jgi:integrase
MALRLIKLVRCQSGAWEAFKTLPKDVRETYRIAFGQGCEVRKRWSADLTPSEAKAAFTAWLSEIENRIAGLREGPGSTPPAPACNGTAKGEKPSARLSPLSLFEIWRQAREPAEGTVSRWRACLVAATEKWPDASAITTDQARAWLRGLINEERSAYTVRGIWRRSCNVVFEHCVAEGVISTNPFRDVRISVPRSKPVLRDKAFSHEELRLILGAASKIDPNQGLLYAARRWCPFLAAYSGARMGELTQLRKEDIRFGYDTGGWYCMLLTPEAGTIKTGRSRLVPLHLSLDDFVRWVQTRGDGPLFYRADHKKRSRPQSVLVLKEIQRWLRKTLKIEGVSTHGFRHAFRRTAARHIEERLIDAICGHSPISIGRGYGTPSIEDKVVAIWQFPRIELE